jgi:hypothetical protein
VSLLGTIARIATAVGTGGTSEIVRAAAGAAAGESGRQAFDVALLGTGAVAATAAGFPVTGVAAAQEAAARLTGPTPIILPPFQVQGQQAIAVPGGAAFGILGGSAAFSRFTPQQAGGGNPAWRSSGTSVVFSPGVSTSLGRPRAGRWVVSGSSVRLS